MSTREYLMDPLRGIIHAKGLAPGTEAEKRALEFLDTIRPEAERLFEQLTGEYAEEMWQDLMRIKAAQVVNADRTKIC